MKNLPPSRRTPIALGAAIVLLGVLLPAVPAAAEPVACDPGGPAGPMHVTADCVDSLYAQPKIDVESDETSPVPHRRVSGHFEGTNIEFTIYLHAEQDKAEWDGRFFQFTYPVPFAPNPNTARANDRAIGFALTSGGYAVQAGNGSVAIGYRHTAAAAKFAETIAAEYYGSDREIFGYLYGPSGGSLQVVGAAENTDGVWQGFVPLVQAVPQPTSYNFMGRAAAELILGAKAADIRDALMPGGSGDPYATLDEAESAMLTEVHALGIPWKAWEYPDYLLGYEKKYYGAGLGSDAPLGYDPTYVEDFWNAAGYLGAEQSPLGDRVRAELVEMGDTTAHRWNIANRFYYRYQVPAQSERWVGLDQFRSADGSPLYPQRPVKAPGFAGFASGGAAFDGSVSGKVVAVANLYDTDALPWHTDWYGHRIEAALGDSAAENHRVYYNDHADHQDAPVAGERAKHLINWYGIVEQALRDVAAWAEDGVAAPDSTQHSLEGAQVVVPELARQRGGLQPTVHLGSRADRVVKAKVGKPVKLSAVARTPEGGGAVTRVEWDFEGDGDYVAGEIGKPKQVLSAEATHTFTEPGTYFVSVRVSAERDGNVDAQYALLQNIDRVRVVVTE